MDHLRTEDQDDDLAAAAMSGLMALTGQLDGPPLEPPPGLMRGLDRLSSSVSHWSKEIGDPVHVDWADLVTVRARLLQLHRRGRVSANGTCRLLGGTDGWMAINLPRPEDRMSVSALVESEVDGDPWVAIERALARGTVERLVERARLLDIPAARVGTPPALVAQCSSRNFQPPVGKRAVADLRIVDLSSMWAGPLATMLLSRCGGRVVKVESSSRPDGARAVPAFYNTLHAIDQEVITLDFDSREGRQCLRTLLAEADVVIESSRQRALEQLGFSFETAGPKPGKIWASITGYCRASNWVAFGDDAAVAAGSVSWEDPLHPVFCGDALADPIAGLSAAAEIMRAIATGGGALLDISMQSCVSNLLDPIPIRSSRRAVRRGARWYVAIGDELVPVRSPTGSEQADTASEQRVHHATVDHGGNQRV